VGNVIGESVCPTLRADVSYFSVFLLLAICTSLSLALFLLGSPHYTKLPPDPAKRVTECTLSPETKEVVWRMARIFAPLPIFWGLYFQQSSTWVFQSQAMNRNLFSWSIPPDIIPTFNDILVCVLIPLLDRLVYPALRRCGLPLLPLSRIAAGILCTALAFVCSGLLQLYIDRAPADSVWVLWQIPQYVFITFAEVLVIITGLEFAYSQAPVHLRSVVSSMTYISSALGQALVAVVEKVSVGSQAGDFFLFAALMFLFLLLFLALVRGYEYRVFETTDERMEDEAAAPVTDVAAAPPSE
jgi:POT family proton-dependent oligopeptide transporter